MLRKLYRNVRRYEYDRLIRNLKGQGPVDPNDLARAAWPKSLEDPLGFYLKCFRYFHAQLPRRFQEHREYFIQERRGFGEDAFHVMWWLLHKEFRLTRFLEIGVYRGQVLTLISLLQRMDGEGGSVTGISPFCPAGDAVSNYLEEVDYLADTLKNFAAFSLPEPEYLRAYSTDPQAVTLLRSQQWDCIYIDGNHDYEIASVDWVNSSEALRPGGLLILDDSGLTTKFVPPPFATKGHPGPSRVAAEADQRRFKEILQVGHNRVFQKII